jgi:uncharacterized protein (DUF697 family)
MAMLVPEMEVYTKPENWLSKVNVVTHNSETSGSQDVFRTATQIMQTMVAMADDLAATTGNTVMAPLQPFLEPATETVGRVVAPITNLPFIEYATALPGVKWLLAAIGQVNIEKVRLDVDDLKRQYPNDSKRQLAQRVMADTTLQAAGIGLITNFVSPVALALTLVDIGAVAALQANMLYRIAAIYGYSPEDDARRGEVLTIWFVSSGGSSVVKSGLSAVETIPGVGAAIGVAADAGLLYSVGYLACRYYETKRQLPTEIAV